MVALSGLTLLVIVCQCGMLTLVLVCLGVRAECNWAKSPSRPPACAFASVVGAHQLHLCVVGAGAFAYHECVIWGGSCFSVPRNGL